MAGFFKKIFSGLDFWDTEENKRQRNQYAQEDEEERKRKAAEAARASVNRPVPGTTVIPGANDTSSILDKPLVRAGSQSDVMRMFDPNKPLVKAPVQPKPPAAPLPDQEFKQINTVGQENKKFLGKNAAWFLPKSLEKVDKVKVEGTYKTNKDKFVAQFDQMDQERREIYLRQIREQAKAGDPAAVNSLRELEAANRAGSQRDVLQRAADVASVPGRSVTRVATGIGQGLSGTYDLLTPGKGNNRVSGFLDKVAENQDTSAEEAGVGTGYKTLNVPVEVASYFIPSTIAAKLASKMPRGALITEKVVDTIARNIDDAGEANKVRRFLADRMRKGWSLERAIEEATQSMKYTGENASKGNDTSPATVATDVATAVGGSLLFPNKLRKALQGDELADEAAGVGIAGTGEIIDNQLTKAAKDISVGPGANAETQAALEEARRIANDVDVPAFERQAAKDEVARLEAKAADEAATAAGAGPDPTDRPAFQHKQDMQNVIDDAEAQLDEFIRENPNADARTLDIARQALRQQVEEELARLQNARTGPVNIPDPTSPITLAKAGDNIPAGDAPIARFNDAIDVPLQKVSATDEVVDALPATTPEGNTALVSDVQQARQLADEGLVPARGESVVGTNEQQLENAANTAAIDEVDEASRVAPYTDPLTNQNIVLSESGLVDEITALQSIPTDQRTVQQARKLRDLLDIYRNWDTASVPGKAPGVSELYPGFSQEGQEAVQSTMNQLEEARTATKDLNKTRSVERGERIARANEAYERAGGGAEGMRAKASALGGEYSKSTYNPVAISDVAQKEILDDIQGSTLRDWQKFNTQRSFEKMWGAVDEKPTPSDVRRIQDYYNSKQGGLGDVIAQQLKDAIKGGEDFKLVEQLAGAPRTLMTTLDFSSPRQAGVLMARHPIEGTKAFLSGVANAFRPKRFAKLAEEMTTAVDQNGVNYSEFMESVMGLHMPNVVEQAAEEAMSSTPLLSRVPLVGRVVKGSNRAFSTTLSELRFNVAKNWIDSAGGVDNVMKNYSPKDLADLGEALNTLSGRGGKAGGFVDKHASILSKTLFSGRLWASRLNMLNPYWYYRLSGPARKEALSSAAAFAALSGTVLTMAAQQDGVEVGTDPRSADFAKIKIGNTRYDILGGLQQNIRVASQILTGKKIDSITGEEEDTTAAKAIGGFVEGKVNPLLGFAWKMAQSSPSDDQNPLTRTDKYGQEINVATEAGKLGIPLPISGVADTAQDTGGGIWDAVKKNVPGFVGAGVQTYGPNANKPLSKEDDINAAAKDGDYDKAIAGWENLIAKEKKRKDPSESKLTEYQEKIEQAKLTKNDISIEDKGIDARIERGEYDKALGGMQYKLGKMDKDTPESDRKKLEADIKRIEITRDKNFDPSIVKLYNDTSNSEWRDMLDPDSGDTNLELAEKLAQYDAELAAAGVSKYDQDPKKTKYFAKGDGGRGGKGSKPKFTTDIATQSFKEGGGFSPLKPISASNSVPKSAIPLLEKVPNYDRSKLKKITVSKGGRP